MSDRMLFLILSVCLCLTPCGARAEVLSVGLLENGVFSAASPTQTFLWTGASAKVTLILIPGGTGHLGLTPDKADLGGFYGRTLKPLSNPQITSGLFNVVIFDSPDPLDPGSSYPTSRAAMGHLLRIEAVVQYYREKFRQPVWLMGHSNGAVSVTEFYRYLQRNHKENMVSGIIYSSGRNGARFNAETNVPVLFLAHEKDGCSKSTNSNSHMEYEALRKSNEQRTEYVLIKSGDFEPQDPCRSGYHMFFNAQEEVYKAIDRFASEILR